MPAKTTLSQVVRTWLSGEGPSPRIFRRCDACGEESWRSLDRAVRKVEVNAWLDDGRRADLVLRDRQGEVVLVVQLASGSRLPNRSQTAAGAPMVVLDGQAVVADALRWRPMRERGLPAWRCRCAHARALPVDDAFSLRVIGCPLNLRRHDPGVSLQGTESSYASVIHDCGRCGFFVGIGYSDPERRRVSLYCSFGAATRQRRPSLLAATPPPPHVDGAAPSISVERSRVA
jgi:hypothetical protein